MTNNVIYTNLIAKNSIKPIAYIAWKNIFNHITEYELDQKIEKTLDFVFNQIEDNRIKMFKWKLLQRILTNNHILYKWKIKDTPLCCICREEENYEHFFTKCRYIQQFLNQINECFRALGYHKNMITLENLALGYKIQYSKYNTTNYLLSYIGYAIYKSYYISEQKSKVVNILNILKNELQMAIKIKQYHKAPCPQELQTVGLLVGIHSDTTHQ